MGSKKEDQNYLNPLTYAFKARDISGPFIFGRRDVVKKKWNKTTHRLDAAHVSTNLAQK